MSHTVLYTVKVVKSFFHLPPIIFREPPERPISQPYDIYVSLHEISPSIVDIREAPSEANDQRRRERFGHENDHRADLPRAWPWLPRLGKAPCPRSSDGRRHSPGRLPPRPRQRRRPL